VQQLCDLQHRAIRIMALQNTGSTA
jgi:hypothetical protein